jgi:anti-sigma-K factor RskA
MTPEELQELCALYVLGTLSPEEAATIEARLQAGDPEVIREVRVFRQVIGILPHALPSVAPSPAVRMRLMARVQASLAETDGVPEMASLRSFLVWLGRPFVWFPATVMILLILTLIWLTYDLRQQVVMLEAEVRQLRQAASERERLFALLAMPEVKIVSLAGTEHAPAAGARLLWDTQRGEWTVILHDLPRLLAEKTYQLWLLTAQGALPSGTFQPDPRQQGIIQATLPAGHTDIAGAAVSIEPEGGVVQPTENIVLVGQF